VSRKRKARLSLPDNVHVVRVKGKEYAYHIRGRGTKHQGPRTPLPGMPNNPDGSPNEEWWTAYRALEGEPGPSARAGTYAALIRDYQASPEWADMSEGTRVEWGRHHKTIKKAWGDLQLRATEPKHVLQLRDSFADIPPADPKLRTKPLEKYKDRPAAANNLLRALSALLSWSVPRGWRPDNPCDHVPKLKGGDGYPPWPMRAIDHHRKHGRPHLWYVAAHALYTGQRQSDVLGMLKADVHDGEIKVLQDKTRKPLWIPLHKDLKAIQVEMTEAAKRAETPRLSKHLLVNSHGIEWTQDGFRASWQAEMAQRIFKPFKAHRLVFHGLRKSAVVFLLEAGCTDAEVAAITGQSREMVEHYAQMVNQRKLARAAILKWENADARNENNQAS